MFFVANDIFSKNAGYIVQEITTILRSRCAFVCVSVCVLVCIGVCMYVCVCVDISCLTNTRILFILILSYLRYRAMIHTLAHLLKQLGSAVLLYTAGRVCVVCCVWCCVLCCVLCVVLLVQIRRLRPVRGRRSHPELPARPAATALEYCGSRSNCKVCSVMQPVSVGSVVGCV